MLNTTVLVLVLSIFTATIEARHKEHHQKQPTPWSSPFPWSWKNPYANNGAKHYGVSKSTFYADNHPAYGTHIKSSTKKSPTSTSASKGVAATFIRPTCWSQTSEPLGILILSIIIDHRLWCSEMYKRILLLLKLGIYLRARQSIQTHAHRATQFDRSSFVISGELDALFRSISFRTHVVPFAPSFVGDLWRCNYWRLRPLSVAL